MRITFDDSDCLFHKGTHMSHVFSACPQDSASPHSNHVLWALTPGEYQSFLLLGFVNLGLAGDVKDLANFTGQQNTQGTRHGRGKLDRAKRYKLQKLGQWRDVNEQTHRQQVA